MLNALTFTRVRHDYWQQVDAPPIKAAAVKKPTYSNFFMDFSQPLFFWHLTNSHKTLWSLVWGLINRKKWSAFDLCLRKKKYIPLSHSTRETLLWNGFPLLFWSSFHPSLKSCRCKWKEYIRLEIFLFLPDSTRHKYYSDIKKIKL